MGSVGSNPCAPGAPWRATWGCPAGGSVVVERRRQTRATPDAVYQVRWRPGGAPVGRIINLSRYGFLTLGPQPVTVNRRLELLLDLGPEEGSAIPLVAEAVWCRPSSQGAEYGAGFRICEIDEADARRIEQAVGG